MEALNLLKSLKIEESPKIMEKPKVDPDPELLQDLLDWKPTPKTVQAEIEFLKAYFETHGFERDQRRLAALEQYLAG